jgi:predicted AAA+ superfamily ATPase
VATYLERDVRTISNVGDLTALRGAIFESWVVSEIYKHRMNRGEPGGGGLSFYRDRDGAEADLIVEHPGRLTIVEAKSAQTAGASLFAGAKRVRGHLDDPSRPCDVVVAYGGEEAQRRSDAKLVPWADLHGVKWIG